MGDNLSTDSSQPAESGRTDLPGERNLSDPGQWVDLHGDYLFRYALARVRNPAGAEDLVQETFLAALKSKCQFTGQSSERSWLTGILRHKMLDHFRKAGRERAPTPDESGADAFAGQFDAHGQWREDEGFGPTRWDPDASELLERKEFMEVLQDCIEGLPPRSAVAFVLREMESMDTDQIREILNLSESNVWVLLHRARMQLRSCLEVNWFAN